MIEQPLTQVLILLAGALLVVTLVRRMRLPAILGYLLTGMALGPFALGLVSDSSTTQTSHVLVRVHLLPDIAGRPAGYGLCALKRSALSAD